MYMNVCTWNKTLIPLGFQGLLSLITCSAIQILVTNITWINQQYHACQHLLGSWPTNETGVHLWVIVHHDRHFRHNFHEKMSHSLRNAYRTLKYLNKVSGQYGALFRAVNWQKKCSKSCLWKNMIFIWQNRENVMGHGEGGHKTQLGIISHTTGCGAR